MLQTSLVLSNKCVDLVQMIVCEFRKNFPFLYRKNVYKTLNVLSSRAVSNVSRKPMHQFISNFAHTLLKISFYQVLASSFLFIYSFINFFFTITFSISERIFFRFFGFFDFKLPGPRYHHAHRESPFFRGVYKNVILQTQFSIFFLQT